MKKNLKHRDTVNPMEAKGGGPWMMSRVEYVLLGLIVLAGAWLRFMRMDLLEFQGDEAYATQLAVDFVRNGKLPLAGLMSSVGVTNPPLFIYLLIPMFMVGSSPVFVSGCIALLGLGAVVATWHVGRRYYGTVAGLVAAALFAVAPWAVIYSRKIWAQDFVPVLATGAIWAMHALVLGKKPRAVFWVVMLPLCVAQVHFSGVIMTASVALILVWLRPKMDWRFAVAGFAAAMVFVLPYLKFQSDNHWQDLGQAMKQVRGDRPKVTQPLPTVHPVSGYRLPGKRYLQQSLAISNAGQIEDVLGITADSNLDQANVHATKPGTGHGYFSRVAGLSRMVLLLQRLAIVGAVIWLIAMAVPAVRKMEKFPFVAVADENDGRGLWLLVLWVVLPPLLFALAGLQTYLTYFAILFPAQFLVQGVALQRLTQAKGWIVPAVVVSTVLVVANIAFMLAFYGFVGSMGGAQGTYGSGLGYKIQAARFLAAHGGKALQEEAAVHVKLAMTRGNPMGKFIVSPRLLQLNHEGNVERPQLEWPWLIGEAYRDGYGTGHQAGSTNSFTIIWDRNREAFPTGVYEALMARPQTNFGPIHLVIVER